MTRTLLVLTPDALKEIVVFDVQDQTASAEIGGAVTAEGRTG